MNNCPDWSIGHIDPELMTMQRSFEVSQQDIYSFLTNDVAEAFECFFIFDTLSQQANIYKITNYGKDTNIHVSYNNLLKNAKLNCSTDDIKTCMTVTGSDDLTLREINFGQDKIYNFDYYNSIDYWSQSLCDAYNKWVKKRNDNIARYNSLLAEYQKANEDINYLTYVKMPADPESQDWSEYGYYPLKEKKDVYEQRQAVSMKAGHGSEESPFYETEYKPIYDSLEAINTQLVELENELNSMKASRDAIQEQMAHIADIISMGNNFTEAQLKELSAFIRETSLSSDNFVVTDTMTDEERIEMLTEMLNYGNKELAKVSTPQLSFSADMVNLFNLPEFDVYSGDFEVGNYIWVTLRDDYSIKAKLLSYNIDFFDCNSFSVTFGNVVRKANDIFTDIQDAINQAQSAATSVSFNQSHWSQAAKETDDIGKMISDGLLSAGNYLSSGADSELLMDKRGMFVTTTSGKYAYKDSIYIGGGRILFTDDNWKTVSEAIGRVTIKDEEVFGVIAQAILAGYVGGSTVEGTDIFGGTITGTNINNGNGTFSVDENGVLLASQASIKGEIKASSGLIGCDDDGNGGFKIEAEKLYNGKDSLTSTQNGVYVGTDGIALGATTNNVTPFKVDSSGNVVATSGTIGGFTLSKSSIYNGKASIDDSNNGVYIGTNGISLGANSVFKVTNTGSVTATSGSIGGAKISDNSIYAENGNWGISSDGTAYFKNASMSDNVTFSSTIDNPFGGKAVNHIQNLALGQITAENITATGVMEAFMVKTDYIESSTGKLNPVVIPNISADIITSGTISANLLDSETVTSKVISSKVVTAESIATACSSPTQGTITVGTLRTASLSMYNGQYDNYTDINTIINNIAENVVQSYVDNHWWQVTIGSFTYACTVVSK